MQEWILPAAEPVGEAWRTWLDVDTYGPKNQSRVRL